MNDLFWPGDERAGELFTGPALLAAMVRVESAWLAALIAVEVTGPGARDDLDGLVGPDDVAAVAGGSEAGGNPVIPLLSLLRQRLGDRNPEAARWLHRGLTSQDVLDTALMLCLRDVVDRLRGELAAQIATLVEMAGRHRDTAMVGRTLTQHAVPITFGLKVTQWLTGVLDAADDLDAVELPAQFGGAAGTLAGSGALAELAGLPDPPRRAAEMAEHAALALGLRATPPWHTSRAPVTRAGDTLVRCSDAYGRIATDVLTLSRPEIGELAEAAGGGSSTMPDKANPVLSVLIRRAALANPAMAATLHLAAAEAGDERPAGAWHVEWATVRALARHTVTAASQSTEMLAGLRVHPDRMRATLDAASADVLAERRALAALFSGPAPDGPALDGPASSEVSDPAGYLGSCNEIIDTVLDRARTRLKELR